MRVLRDLATIIHKLKYKGKLTKDEKTKAFIWIIFVLSAVVMPFNNANNTILLLNLLVFIALMFTVIWID